MLEFMLETPLNVVLSFSLMGIAYFWVRTIRNRKGDEDSLHNVLIFFYIFENLSDTWKPFLLLLLSLGLFFGPVLIR